MAKYVCGVCGVATMVVQGEIVRKCDCVGPIVAELRSELHGEGGVSP